MTSTLLLVDKRINHKNYGKHKLLPVKYALKYCMLEGLCMNEGTSWGPKAWPLH